MKESVLCTKIVNYLRDEGAYVEKIWGGGFQKAGIPDIIASYKGVFLGIEVKVGSNGPSPIQKKKIQLINESGGIGIVVWDFESVVGLIKLINYYYDEEMELNVTQFVQELSEEHIDGKFKFYI